MNVLCRVRFVAGTVALVAIFSNATMAAPLSPATVSSGSTNVADVTPVHWRDGRAGLAAGLATGLIIGGLLAAPRYYGEPYPYQFDDYPPRYGGPSAMADPIGKFTAIHGIGHSIGSVEPIAGLMGGGTIVSSGRI